MLHEPSCLRLLYVSLAFLFPWLIILNIEFDYLATTCIITFDYGQLVCLSIRKKWYFYYTQQDLFSQIPLDFLITLDFTGFRWISRNLVNFKF
jgi:hypothetical protein